MLDVLTGDAGEILTQLELLIDLSHDHRVRDALLHALHDVTALRNYAEGCIEQLAALAELTNEDGR